MMMASNTVSSRLSSATVKSGLNIPSRRSSLIFSRPGPTDERGNFAIFSSPADAATAIEISALPCDATKTVLKRHSLPASDDGSFKVLKKDLASSLDQSYPLRGTPTANKRSRSASCSAVAMRNPMRPVRIKRWDGVTRTVSDWDGLRRDPELWFDNGDCLVHLYARGQSRRGPSFRVPFHALIRKNCGSMFSLCFAHMTPTLGTNFQTSRNVSVGPSQPMPITNAYHLFIPAPEAISREAAFQWHITTRNFFAYVCGKPLVGQHLGQALVSLQERMYLFRSGQINNEQDFLEYAEEQGYRDLVDCPDYSLAMLFYAEHFQCLNVWIDAFAHSVGMNNSLVLSSEFESVSQLTKALITRAYLEMDIHLERVSFALSNFLEDDLSPTFLGLTEGSRAHLDRFRSFLRGFYVEKFGYWPPPSGSAFPKVLYKSMYFDFKNLHDYLVDLESSADLSSQRPASGGICVLQNVQAFDSRHNFIPLPHPLSLIPQCDSSNRKAQSQKAFMSMKFSSKQARTDRYITTRDTLIAATNTTNASVTRSPIVQAYMRFERQCALNNQREEKVPVADARKIRWLLIYGIFQYLIAALRAPKEVRDPEGPEYPLCCLVTEQPPWQTGTRALKPRTGQSINVPEAINNYLSESVCEVPNQLTPGAPKTSTIQPDCQTDDYFAHTNPDPSPVTTRPVSVEVPAPLRIASPSRRPSTRISSPTRRSSVRSFKHATLSALSSRRSSVVLKVPSRPFCEIYVHGYGNGLNETIIDPPSQPISRSQSTECLQGSSTLTRSVGPKTRSSTPDRSCSKQPPNLRLDCEVVHDQSRTPVLDSFQMDQIIGPTTLAKHSLPPSSSNSATSVVSSLFDDKESLTSSQSSNSVGPSVSKISSSKERGKGLVSTDRTQTIVQERSFASPLEPHTPPTHRGEFHFSFDSPQNAHFPDVWQMADSLAAFGNDPDIGVAFSEPPSRPMTPPAQTRSSLSSRRSSVGVKPQPGSCTQLPPPFSAESLSISKSRKRSKCPNSAQGREGVMDIFSALSLAPTEPKGMYHEPMQLASDTKRDSDSTTPPPISRDSTRRGHATKARKATLDEENRGRKREKRTSLGFSLRRR